MSPLTEVLQLVPDEICHLNKDLKILGQTRRLEDHSIVGAYQACNHTCPTFCVDTYEPVCAQIWREGMEKYFFRPMVNHCHVDLISCTLAVSKSFAVTKYVLKKKTVLPAHNRNTQYLANIYCVSKCHWNVAL